MGLQSRVPSRSDRPSRRLAQAATLVALAMLSGCRAPAQEVAPTQENVSGTSVSPPPQPRGIDVSHRQGTVEWKSVAADGVSFAFLKATESTDWSDPLFASNWEGAKTAGILRGAYHFFRPEHDGASQAAHFLGTVTTTSTDLPPVLDIEVRDSIPTARIVSEARSWLEKVEEATGVVPIIYTDRTFWNALDAGSFDRYPLWIAEYGVDSPTLPAGWTSWTFWQHTSSGHVPGIGGAVDESVFNGSLDELRRLSAR